MYKPIILSEQANICSVRKGEGENGYWVYVIGRVGSTKMSVSQPLEPVIVTLHGEGDPADGIKLKLFRWGDFPGLSGWTQYSHRGP